MQKIALKWLSLREWKLILLSCFLMFLSYEPFQLTFFTFISMIPFFTLISETTSQRRALRLSFTLGYVFTLTSFFWIARVIHQFGELSWPLSTALLALYALIGEPTFLLVSPFLYRLLRTTKDSDFIPSRMIMICVCYASLFAVVDWTIPKLFVDTFGHGYVHWTSTLQLAELTGAQGLTFLWAFSSLYVFFLYQKEVSKNFQLKRVVLAATPLILLWGIVIVFGESRIRYIEKTYHDTSNTKTLKIAAIQANIEDKVKILAEKSVQRSADFVLDTYFRLSDEALSKEPKLDLIAWPETAYPSLFLKPETPNEQRRDQALFDFSKKIQTPLILGGYGITNDGLTTNTLIYLDEHQNVSTYAKSILLMFGETLPLVDLFPVFRSWFPMIGFFGKGPGPTNFSIRGTQSLLMICYEALFPWFAQDGLKNRAQWILNATNDSWFGPISAPEYHFNLVRIRSIETRIPQVRVTNTGFTALIEPTGKIVGKTKLFTEDKPIYSVTVLNDAHTLSLYPKIFPFFYGFLWLLALTSGFFIIRKMRF